jgi:hypothetical protein
MPVHYALSPHGDTADAAPEQERLARHHHAITRKISKNPQSFFHYTAGLFRLPREGRRVASGPCRLQQPWSGISLFA